MAAKTMMVAGVKFRHSNTFSDGEQHWHSESVMLRRTSRGNWVAHMFPGWLSCVCKTPEEALTEARRRELRIEMKRHEREMKRHEREMKRITREIGTEEVAHG